MNMESQNNPVTKLYKPGENRTVVNFSEIKKRPHGIILEETGRTYWLVGVGDNRLRLQGSSQVA